MCAVPLAGLAALGAHAQKLWTAFPDVRMEQTGPRLADGEFGAAPVQVAGTHRGSVDELPATRRSLVVQAVVFAETSGGLLARVRTFFDLYDAGRQLGVLPPRGGTAERALLMLRGFGLRLGR